MHEIKVLAYGLTHCYRQGDELAKMLHMLGRHSKMVVMSEIDPAWKLSGINGSLQTDWTANPRGALSYACEVNLLSAMNKFKSNNDKCRLVYADSLALQKLHRLANDAVTNLYAQIMYSFDFCKIISATAIREYVNYNICERRSRKMLESITSTIKEECGNAMFVFVAGDGHIDQIKDMIDADKTARNATREYGSMEYTPVIARLPQLSPQDCVKKTLTHLPRKLDSDATEAIRNELNLGLDSYYDSSKWSELYAKLERILPVERLCGILDQTREALVNIKEDDEEHTRQSSIEFNSNLARVITDTARDSETTAALSLLVNEGLDIRKH